MESSWFCRSETVGKIPEMHECVRAAPERVRRFRRLFLRFRFPRDLHLRKAEKVALFRGNEKVLRFSLGIQKNEIRDDTFVTAIPLFRNLLARAVSSSDIVRSLGDRTISITSMLLFFQILYNFLSRMIF